MGDSGEPQIISMKMKTFDEDRVKNELIRMEEKSSSEDRDSPDSSRQSRFTGKFHRRSIRRGSKYKMTHRSPTELSKVKKVRRAKANDRERMRMQTLNQVRNIFRVFMLKLFDCCLKCSNVSFSFLACRLWRNSELSFPPSQTRRS